MNRPMSAMTSDEIRAQAQERREVQAVARVQREALLGRDRRFMRATDADEIAALPSDATLVVVRVYGEAAAGLVFVRADAAANDARNDSLMVQAPVPRRRTPSRERTLVFAVPPGHWRITAVTPSVPVLTSFCLGAPEFEVNAGEVVFAGSFGFGESGPRLDMSLDPARTALAAAPGLAERVRAAVYTNGHTFECGAPASYLYAYEIDAAPFHEGYELGSRAQPTAIVVASEVEGETEGTEVDVDAAPPQ
jgi:hypothetical protein